MCLKRTDRLYSICNIVIPFTVETTTEIEPFRWSKSKSVILYVDLKSAASPYSDNANEKGS